MDNSYLCKFYPNVEDFVKLPLDFKKQVLQLRSGSIFFEKKLFKDGSYYKYRIEYKLSLNYKLLRNEKLESALIFNKKTKSYFFIKDHKRYHVSKIPRDLYGLTDEFESEFYINMYGVDLSELDVYFFNKKQLKRLKSVPKNEQALFYEIFPNVDTKIFSVQIPNAFFENLNLKKITFNTDCNLFQSLQHQTLVCSELKEFIVKHSKDIYENEKEFFNHFFELYPYRCIPYVNNYICQAFLNKDLQEFSDEEIPAILDMFKNNPHNLAMFVNLKRVPLEKLHLFIVLNDPVPF